MGNTACPSCEVTLHLHNDAPKWNARREKPPKRFLELVRAIEAMVRQPGALEAIRKLIHHAGAEFAKVCINVGPLPNLLGPGDPLSLDEKVVVLAGFHDAFHKAGRVHEIMPDEEFLGGQVGNFATPREETTFSLPIAMYKDVSAYFLDGCKVPDDSPEIDRLYDYLANVKADLAARGLPRPDDGKADAAEPEAETIQTGRLFWPSIIWGGALVVLEVAFMLGAWLWGQGDNLWQKILASGQYFAGALGVCGVGFVLHAGKPGRQLLKRCKGED